MTSPNSSLVHYIKLIRDTWLCIVHNSVPGRQYIHRDRGAGHWRLYQDYFSEAPTYDASIFRCRCVKLSFFPLAFSNHRYEAPTYFLFLFPIWFSSCSCFLSQGGRSICRCLCRCLFVRQCSKIELISIKLTASNIVLHQFHPALHFNLLQLSMNNMNKTAAESYHME
jgi:hypothetical protein